MTENLYQSAWEYFAQKAWPHVAAEPGRIIQTLFTFGNAQYNGYLHVLADTRQLVFYTVFPRHVPPKRITAAQELLTRINYDLVWGNFELHIEGGGVRFKTSLALGDAPFSPELLQPLAAGNVTMMFRYHPCLDALIDTKATATEALQQAT